MERVLKRVGLSRRTAQQEANREKEDTEEQRAKIRRRRRSKSRRRAGKEAKKTRGLFSIDWESVKECKSCKSRAITRRFCSKRCDNELYRSNSFKFERFVRGSEEASTLGKKVSSFFRYIMLDVLSIVLIWLVRLPFNPGRGRTDDPPRLLACMRN